MYEMDRLSWKSPLGAFGSSGLIFRHVVVFLLLTRFDGGESQESGQPQRIVATVGNSVTLPCFMNADSNPADHMLEWSKLEPTRMFVHVRRLGKDHLVDQNPSYQGRTLVSEDNVRNGDMSLQIYRVRLSDEGIYRCFIPGMKTESKVQLSVDAVIEISTVNGEEFVCESKGWYAEPEVLWLDGEGNLLSAGPTETVRGPDHLYTVSSRVTVEKRHSNTFTCRVQQKIINQTRETQIYVPDDFFVDPLSSPVRISITLVVSFMCVLTCVLILWRVNKTMTKKSDKDFELQRLMEEHRDGEQVMTVTLLMKCLDKKKAKLDQESQRNQEDLKHVEQMINVLTEVKNDLKMQRDKHNSLLQEVKIDIKENEKKIKETPKLDKDKKKEKRHNQKEKLKKREEEYKELLSKTEKLVEETDRMVVKMTERKAKLERDKEQIDKTLEELEEQRDEVQRNLI